MVKCDLDWVKRRYCTYMACFEFSERFSFNLPPERELVVGGFVEGG